MPLRHLVARQRESCGLHSVEEVEASFLATKIFRNTINCFLTYDTSSPTTQVFLQDHIALEDRKKSSFSNECLPSRKRKRSSFLARQQQGLSPVRSGCLLGSLPPRLGLPRCQKLELGNCAPPQDVTVLSSFWDTLSPFTRYSEIVQKY